MEGLIGQSVSRVDGRDKATGRLGFVSDYLPPRALIGKIFRSPIPHGRIVRLDLEDARKAPGVRLVMGFEDAPRHRYNPIYNQQNPHSDVQVKDEFILDDTLRYIGQPVALVVAETGEQAEGAFSAIHLECEPLPAVFDLESALRPDAPVVRPEWEGNISFGLRDADRPIYLGRGDVEKGFAEADEVFEDEWSTQRVNQAPLETHVICCWPEAGDRVAVYSTTQAIFGLRARLSEATGLPLSTFRVIRPVLGGGFGKGLDLVVNEPLCALAAMRLNRPVRITSTPEEEFTRTARHPSRMWVKTGLKKDGTLTARHMRAWMDCGASANHGPSVVLVGGNVFVGAYKTPHHLFEGFAVYTNNFPSGAMRGYGAVQTNFAVECHMSRIAEEMGFDPFEFRVKNAYEAGDISPMTDLRINSCGLSECAVRARALIGWDDPKTRTPLGPSVKVGVGLAFCGMKNSGVHTGKDLAEKVIEYCGAIVKANEDGTVALNIASIEQGGGQATALSQIVADALGVPLEHVTVVPNDSDSAPFDAPTHASRITFAAGHSARLAALDARNQILEAAGRMMDVNPGDLEISGGVVSSRDSSGKSLSVGEIVETVHYKEMVSIIGKATTQPPGNPPAFGVQCVKVAVDEETGEVEILDMSDVHDIGRVVNPLGAAGQVEGAFAQGIGLAVSEHLVINEASGTVENAQFGDYKIPTTLDVPLSRVGFAEGDESLQSEMKGVSETTMNSPAAAIANAVYDAVGVRIHALPITPEKILEGLRGRSG